MSSGEIKYMHALVIGGTGMLKGVSIHLCKSFKAVSVIGRNKHRFYSLIRETEHLKGNILPIEVDYTKEQEVLKKVEGAVENYGDVSLVISWVHSTAPAVAFKIAERVSPSGKNFRFFDVLGSAHADPSLNSKEREEREMQFGQLPSLQYRKIILGFVMENDSPRWLTDDEISSGIIYAVENDIKEYVIGTVTPWESKP